MIDRKAVYNKYGGHCAYCGEEIEFKAMQVDHIIAQDRGGSDDIENLNPACRSCNATKNTYSVEKFRTRLVEDVNRMRRDSSKFRILERFGLIKEVKKELKFYFEGKD